VAVVDLGCAKNTVDSEEALGRLLEAGWTFAPEPEEADLVLVNTCGFIESAREESVEHLLEVAALKEERPALKVVAMGCLVQRHGAELREAIPELDGLLGFSAYEDLAAVCARVVAGERLYACAPEAGAPLATTPRLLLTGGASAYLRLADGCDNRCTYCAVPLIRGGFRSRPAEEILAEAEQLVGQGARELCLVAQDISYYGADRTGTPRLAGLLEPLLARTGEAWIRLLYAHPAHLDEETLALLGARPRLLGYLDLPIQHINSGVLDRMGRRVDRPAVEDLLERFRRAVPHGVLRTSVITGFPGEDEAAFRELLDFVAAGHFQHLGAFAYSPEEGTPAAALPGQVPPEVAAARAAAVMEAQQEVTFAWLESRLGGQETVLIEGTDARGLAYGRSRAEAPEVDGAVWVRGGDFSPGQLILACHEARDGYDLMAQGL
jgi:ribosomal protein S12 methylthiotransferase